MLRNGRNEQGKTVNFKQEKAAQNKKYILKKRKITKL